MLTMKVFKLTFLIAHSFLLVDTANIKHALASTSTFASTSTLASTGTLAYISTLASNSTLAPAVVVNKLDDINNRKICANKGHDEQCDLNPDVGVDRDRDEKKEGMYETSEEGHVGRGDFEISRTVLKRKKESRETSADGIKQEESTTEEGDISGSINFTRMNTTAYSTSSNASGYKDIEASVPIEEKDTITSSSNVTVLKSTKYKAYAWPSLWFAVFLG